MNETDKKTKKKLTIRFLLYVLGGGLFGICLALGSFAVSEDFIQLFSTLYQTFQIGSPWIFMALCLITLLPTYLLQLHVKKLMRNWRGSEQETDDIFYEQVERLLTLSLCISQLGMIVTLMVFPLVTIATLNKHCKLVLFFLCVLFFLFSMIFTAFLQRKSVEQIRILNPEKKGDAFELRFKKKWLESLDEQERFTAYAASYKAFSSLNPLFFTFFILLILLVPFFNISFLPFLCIGCMWLIPNAIYLWESFRKHSKTTI